MGTFVVQDALDHLGQDNSEKELNRDETESKQPLNQNKRKVDHSTKIFNFYNKGNVNVGTGVVQMKPSKIGNTQAGDLESDSNTSPEERFALPPPELKEESFAKRLKYSQSPQPAITYPTDTETSDDSEYVSSTSNIDTIIDHRNIKPDTSTHRRDRDKSDTVHHDVLQPTPICMVNKHVCAEAKTGLSLLRRQQSAPCGY